MVPNLGRRSPGFTAARQCLAIIAAAMVATAAWAGDGPASGASVAGATPLAALVDEALKNNPELRAASRELEAAQARVRPAGALDDPMLEAGVLNAPVRSLSLDAEDMTMKMLGLGQKLPYPGKRALRAQVAARDADTVRHGLNETANRIVRDVKLAYYDLALSAETVRQLNNNRLILEQFLRIAEGRYSVGQAAQSEVLRAQTQLSRMTDELLRTERELPVTRAELARLLGRDLEPAELSVTLPSLGDQSFDLEALRQAALRERPQLLGLQSAIDKSEQALALARKEGQPDFELRVSYGQRDKNPMGMRRDDLISFTVAMNLPVWRRDKTEPRIAEGLAMRDQALAMQRAQQNEVQARLRQQVALAEQARRSVYLYETGILPQARLSVEASLSAYRVSRADLLMLLDSQMALFNYEISRARDLVNFNKALAELDFLVGSDLLGEER